MNAKSIVSPEDQSVTFVELFFDLIFVFSVTQVVGILHDGVTLVACARVMLVFWLVWWSWTQFTWALNAADTDHASVQLLTLLATAVAFFMAVAVPNVFEGGALFFAIPYVLVRLVGLAIYVWAASQDKNHLTAVRTFGTISIGGLAAVIVGASIGGEQLYWFWGLAILLDVIAAWVGGSVQGWNLHPSHFVERHGLIVIIALGESLIVAAGGFTSATRDATLVAVAVGAVALTCALWWSYFPYFRPALEEALERSSEESQAGMARDVFSLAHFPMLLGVIGIAAAIEEAIAHSDHALPIGGRAALAGGLILFLGGAGLAHWRALRVLPTLRLVIVVVASIAIILFSHAPPWVTVAMACAAVFVIAGAEHRRYGHRFETVGS